MFIISEIFPQHGGSLEVAEQMILQSKMAGADAIKVQLYTADQFGSERAYLELDIDGLRRLRDYADNLCIPLFGTPFTMDRLDWCMELELPYLKVAARMHRESPDLVAKIMEQNVPTFVSIPSDLNPDEVPKFDHATYLHCIVKYPTRLDEFEIPDFSASVFEGVSDHSIGISGAIYAAAHGARYLEKHYTTSHGMQYATEQAHVGSMDFEQLKMIKNITSEMERIGSSL